MCAWGGGDIGVGAHEDLKNTSDLIELEIQAVVSWPSMGAGNTLETFCKSSMYAYPLSNLLSPPPLLFHFNFRI